MPYCSSPPVSRSKHSRPDPIPAAHSGRSRSDLFGIIGLSCMQHGPHPTALWPSLHKKKYLWTHIKSLPPVKHAQHCSFSNSLLRTYWDIYWDIYLGDKHGLLNIQHRIFCSTQVKVWIYLQTNKIMRHHEASSDATGIYSITSGTDKFLLPGFFPFCHGVHKFFAEVLCNIARRKDSVAHRCCSHLETQTCVYINRTLFNIPAYLPAAFLYLSSMKQNLSSPPYCKSWV